MKATLYFARERLWYYLTLTLFLAKLYSSVMPLFLSRNVQDSDLQAVSADLS